MSDKQGQGRNFYRLAALSHFYSIERQRPTTKAVSAMQRSRPETVTLDDIVITQELSQRSPRSPNWQAEAQAMHTLARQLVNQPEAMLQTLVDIAVDLCSAGSAGVSLLEVLPSGEEVFRQNVLAGTLAQYVGGTTERNFSLCGVCLDRGSPVLFSHPERYFTYFQAAKTPLIEGLVLPLIANDRAFGTIWIMSHDEQRHFDSEDVRVMTSLADFTAAALMRNQQQTRVLAANAALEAQAERKQAEERVLRKASLTHALIENLPGGAAFVVDQDLRYQLVEGKALSAAGIKPADLVGHTIFEVLPPELATTYEVLYRKALAGESFEYEHNAHNRSYISRGTPLRSPNGEVYAALAVSYDISDRKQAEAEIRRLSERNRHILESITDAFAVLDHEWRYTYINDKGAQILGSTPEQLQGRTIWEGLPKHEETPFGQLYLQVARTKVASAMEAYFPPFDAWYSVRVYPSEDGITIFNLDVTDRKRAEADLRESEEKYRSLFESIDEGFCIIEVLFDETQTAVDYRFLDVNPSFVKQTGMENAVGKRVREFVPQHDAHWFEIYGRVVTTGESVRFENRAEQLNRWYDVYAFRVGEPADRKVGVLFNDISDHKRAESALRESEAKLAIELADTQQLQNISSQLIHEENIDALYEQILNAAIALMRSDMGSLQMLDSERRELRLLAWKGFHPDSAAHWEITGESTSSCGGALRVGERLIVPDVNTADFLKGNDNLKHYELSGIVAMQSTPLVTRDGRIVGMISTHWRDRHVPSERELRLFDVLARQAADVLERKRAEEALRASEARFAADLAGMRRLYDLHAKLALETDLHAALEEIVATACEFTNTDRGCVQLVSDDGNRLEMYAWCGYSDDSLFISHFRYEGAKVACDMARRHRQRLIIEDVENFPPLAGTRDRMVALAENIRATQSTPMITRQGEMVGVLSNQFPQPYRPTDHELRLIDLLAWTAADFVARHHAERAVRESERKLQSAIAVAQLSPYEWNPITGELKCDARLKAMWGLPADAQINYEIYNAGIHPQDREYVERQVAKAIDPNGDGIFEAEFRTVGIEDIERWVSVRGQTFFDEQGRPVHYVGAAQDVTDRKQAEADRIQLIQEQAAREEERQRAESLAELDRAKTLFFSNVSHEFRTPLTLLLAPLQDALSDRVNPLSPLQRERLELAHRNAIRLLKLVNTLLDFSRIEALRMEAVYEPTDLATYTTQLASVFRSAIEQAGLQLVVDCPPFPEPVYVDREMWEKIVLNLLSNAFKFTLSGAIAVRLHPKAGDSVMLQIQDTGIGISPENLPHIFDRFYQVRGAASRTHEGSGIGLALVHELIRLHGGTVDVNSTVGQGTCFTVTIPLGTAHQQGDRLRHDVGNHTTTTRMPSTELGAAPYIEEAERWLPQAGDRDWGLGEPVRCGGFPRCSNWRAREEIRAGEAGVTEGEKPFSSPQPLAPSPSPARILLVDDNADMRDYLMQILGDRFQVEAVADGAAALAAARAQVPDLVLSDVMMPGLDGFRLLQALRTDPRTKEIPIILLSARAGVESIVEGLEAGADDYLIKPFWAAELVSRVNAHLQMAQLRSEALQQERITSRRKDELLSIVSHELNTPLVAILGWTRLLRANPPSQSMLIKSLDTIERNATLQAKLIQDLLDISRIEAGKLRLNLQPVELKSVMENAIAAVLTAAIAKNIHLHWKPDVRDLSVTVLGDADRLGQIISNLLTNAIKFTPEGGSVEVHLSFVENKERMTNDQDALAACRKLGQVTLDKQPRTSSDYAEIRVIDTGIGIAADFLPYIFERFCQAESPSSVKGLGLGLAIARHLVSLHNGTIHAESSGVGQGATFTVRLPILQEF